MEFPNLGKHCSEPTCNKLDFLPVKCDACNQIYCTEHMTYSKHSCPSAHQKDIQVPVCPLCGSPVPTPRNQPPDIAVSEHIDNDCQSDPAKAKRKVNTNRCSLAGCKVKEMVPVLCKECKKNYCLRHRFPDDHKCEGKKNKTLEAALRRQGESSATSHVTSIQGNMSEDEALARALAESLKNEVHPRSTDQRSAVAASSCNPQKCQIS